MLLDSKYYLKVVRRYKNDRVLYVYISKTFKKNRNNEYHCKGLLVLTLVS